MTYKKVVEAVIENESREWVKKIFSENEIDCDYISVDGSTLENSKKDDCIYFETVVTVRVGGFRKKVIVGGTAEDICGVSTSVLWNEKKDIQKPLWFETERTRKAMGIEKLEL